MVVADEKDNIGPELVFGVVGALGANVTFTTKILQNALSKVGYQHRTLHLAKLLHDFSKWSDLPNSPPDPLDEYIRKHQDAGDEFRNITKFNDAIARLAIIGIRDEREMVSSDKKPIPRCAYILRSLKHPEEVALLRRVY